MRIKEDARIYHAGTEKSGTVRTLYQEVGVAIVDFDDGTVGKVAIDSLMELVPAEYEVEAKKTTLLDKIKGRFK